MGIANKRGDIVIRLNAMRATLMVVVLAFTLQASPARAQSSSSEAGSGAVAAISSLVYGPVKIVYSVLGVVFGGFAWGLSGGDTEVMKAVISPAVLGDYVITASHIRGEKPVEFIGRRPEYREDQVVLEEIY
jgi:type IV secretory pathway VirB2 component (pilin)